MWGEAAMRDAAASEKSGREDIAAFLRAEITQGALLPGQRIEEQGLAARFGVSKTPVREALIQLASLGLVDLRQRRGATVTVLGIEQVVAMFEVLTQMERMAARLAASRMPAQLQAELEAVHALALPCVAARDEAGYDALNTRLHEVIYRGARNDYLEKSVKDMRARLRIYRRYPFQRPGRMAQSHADHGAILAAIRAGDADAAGAAMEEHMTTGGQVFADLVAEMPRIAAFQGA